jgi:hypothetical protein
MSWRDDLLEIDMPSVWGGIECGDGWRQLIEALYGLVQKYDCIGVAQVKEKFGGLRFYIDHDYECDSASCNNYQNMRTAIRICEELSYMTCEDCGAYAKVRQDLSWNKTLCDNHYSKELERIEENKKKYAEQEKLRTYDAHNKE